MINIQVLPNLFAAICVLAVGIFVITQNTKSKINRSFFMMAVCTFIWHTGTVFVLMATQPQVALVWTRISYLGITFIPILTYQVALAFLGINYWKRRIIIFGYLLNILIIIPLSWTHYLLNGVYRFQWGYWFKAGSLHPLFLMFFSYFMLLTFYQLYKGYKIEKSPLEKNRKKYLMIALLIAYIGTEDFIPVYGYNIYPFAYIPTIICMLIITYAIIRHQLMDISIVIRKTAIYSIVATIITVSYFLLIYIMEGFFRGFIGYKSIPWTLSVIAIFTLIFQPLKNIVQSFVDKYLFKGYQLALAQELKRTQEELKRAERLKAVGTLAAGMAHEIKNPLTGIKTFTEYLPSKHNDPEFLDKFHKIVTAEVNKINDIVQQLLNFSKPKPLELKQSNIHTIIDQTLPFLNNDFIKYRINVIKNYDNPLPLLTIDPNQMQQVFLNLFLNSIDAMKEGGTLSIATNLIPNAVEITIADTGAGISKKDLEHIFDPFYSTKDTGTGLGMSIVYGIIKEHKGEISVISELNKGARFIISFPVV